MALAALLQWGALDVQQNLLLEQDLVLEQTQGAPGVTLPKGLKITLNDQYPLDQIRVQYYDLEISPCPASLKNQISDMTIINDNYGVELAKDCKIGMYVEFKDLYTDSPFSDLTHR
jgi:hypothetical protein